ncbi:hypothetical protein BRC90_00915 [Halobacteriales archaeon QS_4_69_34]|nr:MAG: hypothetical protein BRC90_00915 [Halobacteriales archaeon QS_4_69_34]
MPSTLFHAAVGGLLAAALLETFDERAIGVVTLAVVIPELDVFLGLWIEGAHRTYLNNVFVPLGLAALVYYDTSLRSRSTLARRWGPDAGHIAWVGVLVLAVAGIGVDLFYNGVNLFFPLMDRFYDLSGEMLVSTERGLVQTMIDVEGTTRGTTETTQFRTGVDPKPAQAGTEPATVERLFPVANSGVQFLLTLVGFAVVAYRYVATRRTRRSPRSKTD